MCHVVIPTPSGVQPGDLLIVNLALGAVSSTNPTLPTGWTLLPISNLGTPQNPVYQMQADDTCGVRENTWNAAHVYQSGETSYTFSHFNNGQSTCEGNLPGELVGFIAVYRGATQSPSSLTVYGSASHRVDGGSFTTGVFSPPAETTLLTIFAAPGWETATQDEFPVTFSTPTGSPALTAESPLSGDLFGMLAADVAVPAAGGGSFGSYSTTQVSPVQCSFGFAGCIWYAFEIAIPEF